MVVEHTYSPSTHDADTGGPSSEAKLSCLARPFQKNKTHNKQVTLIRCVSLPGLTMSHKPDLLQVRENVRL